MTPVERLAAAVESLAHGRCCWEPEPDAAAILAADPNLATDLELGQAWREAEAALPEGWFFRLQRLSDRYYIAFSGEAEHPQGFGRVTEPLDTPAAALRALSAKLREAKPLAPPAGLPGVPRRPFR